MLCISKASSEENLITKHANTLSSLFFLCSIVISVAYKSYSVIFLALTLCEDTFSCMCTGISIDCELIATNILVHAIEKVAVDGSKSKELLFACWAVLSVRFFGQKDCGVNSQLQRVEAHGIAAAEIASTLETQQCVWIAMEIRLALPSCE